MKATNVFTAATLDEAIAAGLKTLGLERHQVEIEVLDEGRTGIFGIGAREASVHLTPKPKVEIESSLPPVPLVPPITPNIMDTDEKDSVQDPPSAVEEEVLSPNVEEDDDEDGPGEEEEYAHESRHSDEEIIAVTRETIEALLEKMTVNAEASVRFGKRDRRKPTVLVDITGDDLNPLIGKRAETLSALQYIARLIIGKKLGRSVSVIVDIAGYRNRRDNQLRHLARQMARQAVETGKRQMLEPMPPDERRVIHMELRDYPGVITESVGDGDRRKVSVIPK